MTMTTTTTTSPSDDKKLGAGVTWLFAIGGVAAGIALSFALQGLGQKATAAIYFAIVAAAGFGSTYLTRAKFGGAAVAFAVAAALAGVGYFFLVDHFMRAATTVMTDAVSMGNAHAAGVEAGAMFGRTFGIFAAVIAFLETIIAGLIGSFAGARAKGTGGFAAAAALARSVR